MSSLEEAFTAADYLISTGVELIELCAGFNSHDYQHVIEHIDCSIPVGCAQLSGPEQIIWIHSLTHNFYIKRTES